MSFLHKGYLTGPIIGALWALVMAVTLGVAVSFASGEAARPALWGALVLGAITGLVSVWRGNRWLTDGV
ncbi:MAG: carbohydrate ABC transporter permease, partial [Thioclava sp.]|nr:carbohydrate ABC transporter permease [Thioclava sp.]